MISTALAATAEHGAEALPLYALPEFWVAVAFFLVFGLAFRPVGRAMTAALDARSQKIRARIEEAQRLREDAQEMLVTYQRKQRDAMREAEDILAHAKAEAQRMAEQAARDLEETLKRRERMALDRIAQAEGQALQEVRNLAVDIAIAATRAIIAENLPAAKASALVDSAIKDLPGKLH